MFTEQFSLMLYVADVAAEQAFWEAVGFEILATSEQMGYQSFDMRSHAKSSTTITVYDKAFIQQVSPEVADHVPSILFESDDIYALQAKIAEQTDTASPVQTEPFLTFNFASPSGQYFAVKGRSSDGATTN
ncbi:VOC family protein [Streptococcus entericus]|uniref:VOC family protein n=1 Tax=Streptococcus entericus TaxID=155680 RepID=UPI00038111B4|nr:VOC family protein [Streptococcus entericus]